MKKNEPQRLSGEDESRLRVEGRGKKFSVLDKILLAIFNPLTALILIGAILLTPYVSERMAARAAIREREAREKIFAEGSVFDNVFVAELGKKYDRLRAVRAQKIAVIGGSSVAFGLDSEMLAEETGYEVVNFGLYATLGSKVMLDLSEEGLYPGDIAIFAPELDAQALSLYFGAKSAWQAIDADNDLYDVIAKRNAGDLAAARDEYIDDKAEYLRDGAPDPAGVYNAKNFNVYGDVVYDRAVNTMAMGYDPNTLFTFTESIVSPDFLAYFNTYCENMRDKGVTVYFSFCPINAESVAEGQTDETIKAFEDYLKANVACPVISSLSDYILDWGYFYDTNLHLNEAGVVVRTLTLARDVEIAEGLSLTLLSDLPEPPGFGNEDDPEEDPDADKNSPFADCFLYEIAKMPDGTVRGKIITGVSEKGLALDERDVVLPALSDGVQVIGIEAGVLDKLKNLEVIRITATTTRRMALADSLFAGCEKLTDIYLDFSPDLCSVSTPENDETDGLMVGAPKGAKIHCVEAYREDFRNDYTWGHYYKFFAEE